MTSPPLPAESTTPANGDRLVTRRDLDALAKQIEALASLAPGKLLYTRREASLILSISERTLDYYVALKKLRCRRKGKLVLFERQVLEGFSRRDDDSAAPRVTARR